jgi:O-glycosyl hydrolase
MVLSLTIVDITLAVLLFLLTVLLKERVINYSVMKYLTSEEKRFLNECSQTIRQAQQIIYWPDRTSEKPNHIRKIEDNERRIKYLKSAAVSRFIQRLIFS